MAGAIKESEKLSSISGVLSRLHGSQALGLLLFMTVLPCALMLVSHVMYKKHYRLEEEEYDRICAEIAARKAVDKT